MRLVQAARRQAFPTAAVMALVAGAVTVWRTKIRHSGELYDYAAYLIDDNPAPRGGSLRVTALGTTMMLVDDGITQILVDAFISPVPLLSGGLNRPVATDEAIVDAALDRVGADRVKAIFISHSHFDHAFDVAYIARRTGATVHGSESTLNIARGGNVPEAQLRLHDLDQPVEVGGFTVRTLASKHSPKPMGGEGAIIDKPMPQPAPMRAYKEGGTSDFLISRDGYAMLFKSSANWIPGALDDVRANALFLGTVFLGNADDAFVSGYLDATLGTVQPTIVIATHWNDCFSPVHTHLPLQRELVDHTPAAFDKVIARANSDGVQIGILDAYSKVVLPRPGT